MGYIDYLHDQKKISPELAMKLHFIGIAIVVVLLIVLAFLAYEKVVTCDAACKIACDNTKYLYMMNP